MSFKPNLVYFIRPKGKRGPIKIGCSNCPATRLDCLSAWSPWPLEVIGTIAGTYQDEQFLHECFAHSHSHREWFKATPALLATIEKILAAGTVDAVRGELVPTGSIRKGRKRKEKSPEERLRWSYECKIRHACQRLRKIAEHSAWCEPKDVQSIMNAWGKGRYWSAKDGAYKERIPKMPSPEQIARLDEYLANPAHHSIFPSFYAPKDPICIPIFVGDEVAA